MFTRTFESLPLLILLTACHGQAGQDQPPPGEHKVMCRTDGETQMRPSCTVEQQGQMLMLQTPAGGFRRFRIVSDARGLVAADGAAPAQVSLVSPGQIEVVVEGDHYRLPGRLSSGVE